MPEQTRREGKIQESKYPQVKPDETSASQTNNQSAGANKEAKPEKKE